MSRVLTNEQNYYNIADTIRQMKNVNTTYKPREMSSALKDIYSNEVEGTLPLSFEANGNNLLNYRIDGASGGVGERTSNLLQNTATSQTKNGVTFTVNEDKSITCNGTAEQITQYVFSDNTIYENCVLSGCPSGGGYNNYLLRFRGTGGEQIAETGSGKPISNVEGYVEIRLNTGYTCDNLTFYPMIRLASIQDDTYEPYGYKVPVVCGGTTTNIYLDEPIEENESISLSDTEVDIPTIEGTNTLTIDTTVQPSNVYVQAPKDSEEIVYLTTILEEEI